MIGLGDLMVQRPGTLNPDDFPDERFELYSIPAHDRGGPEIVYGREIGSTKNLVEPGDVLISKIIPHIRRVRIVGGISGYRKIASSEWIVLRGRVMVNEYLRHYLMSDRFHLQFMATVAGVGGSLVRARPAYARSIQVPCPPEREQRRIAAILDQADAIRTKRRQVLAHLDDLSQSIFQDMFGRISAQAVVSDIATAMRTGPFGSQLLREELIGDGISVLGLDNVVDNEFRWGHRRYISPEKYDQLRRYTVYSGDVLISIMGTTGRCVIVPEGIPTAINTKHICAVTVDSSVILPGVLRAVFLWHRESRNYLRRQTKGAIMDGLNMGIIRRMPVPIPSIAQQSEFVARLDAVASRRSSVQRALAADDELFASLQSRAFRGEL